MHLKSRSWIIISALLLIFGIPLLPHPEGLSISAMRVIGIFAGTLLLWLTVAIDWPSMLALAFLGFIPELKFSEILATSLGGTTFAFLLFTFLCTYALSQTPFIRRIALAFINSRFAKRGAWSFAIFFFASALVVGLILSPTVLFVIYLPILNEIYDVLDLKKGSRYGAMLMMGMTFSISIATGMTPIAHVFSTMAMGFYEKATGIPISYVHYMAAGVLVGLICFLAMLLIFRFVLRPDTTAIRGFEKGLSASDLGPLKRREIAIITIFSAVVLVWVSPGLITYIAPGAAKAINAYGIALPPLIGAVAMMILTVDGQPLLNFKEAMSRGIAWPALIMTASTLALGSAMVNESIGLTAWIKTALSPTIGSLPLYGLIFAFVLWAAVQTNLSSNMVTVTLVCAVAIPIAIAGGNRISAAAITSLIGMMGSLSLIHI